MHQACRILIELGASLDAIDDSGQKAIHLAAQADQVYTTLYCKSILTRILAPFTKAEVILMLLEARPSLASAATKEGNTCAHIAAKKGSALVIAELMKFDKSVVIASRNKITESTTLHIATEGGHK